MYLNGVHRKAARCRRRGSGTGDGRYCYVEANPTEHADGFARLASKRTTGSNLYQQYVRLIRKMDPATDPEEERVIEAEMDELSANKIDDVDEQLTETSDLYWINCCTILPPPYRNDYTTNDAMVDRAQGVSSKLLNTSVNEAGSITSLVLSPLCSFVVLSGLKCSLHAPVFANQEQGLHLRLHPTRLHVSGTLKFIQLIQSHSCIVTFGV